MATVDPASDSVTTPVLEHDHRVIDAELARFAASLTGGAAAPDVAALGEASTRLRHHIHVEEVVHFPHARAAGLVGPVMVMEREHGLIWDLLDQLDAAASAPQPDADALLAVLRQLEAVLAAHNAKEEQILYPAGDDRFTPAQRAEVVAALRDGRRPDDWVCAWAGRS